MNDNNGEPTGPIRATAGQDAQATRQNLDSMLGGLVAARADMNRQRLIRGEPPIPEGLTVREPDAPLLIAAHAVCAHLHHLTVKLGELQGSWTHFHDSQANLGERLGDLDMILGGLLTDLGYEVVDGEVRRSEEPS